MLVQWEWRSAAYAGIHTCHKVWALAVWIFHRACHDRGHYDGSRTYHAVSNSGLLRFSAAPGKPALDKDDIDVSLLSKVFVTVINGQKDG